MTSKSPFSKFTKVSRSQNIIDLPVSSPGNLLTIETLWWCGVSSTGGAGGRARGREGGSTRFVEISLNEGPMIPHFLEYLKGFFLALAMSNSFSTPLVVLSDKHSSKGDSRVCSTILCMYMSPSLPVRVNSLLVTVKGKLHALCTSAGMRQ